MCYASLSIFLAQVIGIYLFLMCLSMLLNQQRHKKVLHDFLSDHSFLIFTGGYGVILGLLLVVSHNLWVADWPVLITLIGWITLVQGAMRIFFPDTFIKIVKDMMNKSSYLIWNWIWLLIGIYLIWVGFSK